MCCKKRKHNDEVKYPIGYLCGVAFTKNVDVDIEFPVTGIRLTFIQKGRNY